MNLGSVDSWNIKVILLFKLLFRFSLAERVAGHEVFADCAAWKIVETFLVLPLTLR